MDTRVLSAHVPVELAAQVDAIAARMDRPKGWILKQALISSGVWGVIDVADEGFGRVVDA